MIAAAQLSFLDLMIDKPLHLCLGFLSYAYDPVDIYWDCGCARARRINAIMAARTKARGSRIVTPTNRALLESHINNPNAQTLEFPVQDIFENES